jgi:hypothetical protein
MQLRKKRFTLQLPVQIWGMNADGKPFRQAALTEDVSLSGARLRDVKETLAVDEVIALQHEGQKGRFRVVWAGEKHTVTEGQLKLAAVEPEKIPWRNALPAEAEQDEPVPSAEQECKLVRQETGERRRHARFAREAVFETRGPQRCWGELQDLSLGGCYVNTSAPLPLGTRAEMRITLRDLSVDLAGVVRAHHPGVGMGIEFVEVSPEANERLTDLLGLRPRPLSGAP